ncbi:hypothetical protein [Gaetbulibacter saemankumensis]|uniref:hypothetical protein n=1 Tax=Gaetbulibacter saemankumensis TaxID=311208 RepID=UPI00041EA38E|nr:hypothetical protein [Gaetbulibacter saemankumensis]
MSVEYDRFEINIDELNGKITRKPFTFKYDEFEVYEDDTLVLKVTIPSRIRGVLENENLNVKIIGNEANEYLNQSLYFDTISSDIDNIRWRLKTSIQQIKSVIDNPDYMALFYVNEVLTKISFVTHKTRMQINFFSNKHKGLLKPLSELCLNARKANSLYGKGNVEESKPVLLKIYHSVKNNPQQLRSINNYENLGRSFLLMLDSELTKDIDSLQFIVSIGYLCTSLAIEDNKENINNYKDRLLLLNFGHKPIIYTVMDALNLISGNLLSMSNRFAELKARDAIYKMEMFDLESNPMLCAEVDFFQKRKNELEEMIKDEFFLPDRTKENVLATGLFNHQSLLTYLENKVMVNGDVDF